MNGHARWEGMMASYFTGQLAASDAAALASHTRDCSDCERLHQRYALAERALEGGDRPLTWAARGRVADRLFAPAARPRPSLSWVSGLVMAAASAALLLVVVPRLELPTSGEFVARGGPALEAGTGLRALRIRADASGALQVDELGVAERRLRARDHLRVLYTNLGGAERVELSSTLDGRTITLLPGEVALVADAEDQPLGEPLEVPADWRGALVIRARFVGRGAPLERELRVEVE